MSRGGVDCSGFVLMTFRDKFDLQLPRETRMQAKIGTEIDKDELLPGDLVFLKRAPVKAAFMSASMIPIISSFMPRPAVA